MKLALSINIEDNGADLGSMDLNLITLRVAERIKEDGRAVGTIHVLYSQFSPSVKVDYLFGSAA